VPDLVVSNRTSKIAGEPPYSTGAPGRLCWLITSPLRVSAVCWTIVPTSVTGAMNPDSGIEMNSTGIPQLAQSTTFWLVTSLHLIGEVGQQENTVNGLASSSSRLPRTASWRFFMISNAPTVKAPVTTGLGQ
jgi:hypothetical protein